MTRVKVGDKAPDFTAEGTGNKTYRLSESFGENPVVLVFYPGDSTPVCTDQLNAYTADFGNFESLGATVFALSPQDVASHEAFHAEHNFAFPLLFDENKRIAESYGVVGPLGFYRRSVFVIDTSGVIVYAARPTAGLSYPSSKEIVDALRSASAAAS